MNPACFTGDEFLVAIGSRMKNVVRSRDLLARFGGDEFVALLEDVAGVDVPVAAARRICAALERPIVLRDGYEVVASVSVGIALSQPGKSADDIPVQEVKVDRTFVQGMVENPVDSAIVRAVIDLADAMGIAAVAEGVETEGQLAGLRMLGCPIAQGFYFSQPLRAGEFDDLLTRHFACTSASG
jgi:predicted signal transduction protein with EAL and GGDEF domain